MNNTVHRTCRDLDIALTFRNEIGRLDIQIMSEVFQDVRKFYLLGEVHCGSICNEKLLAPFTDRSLRTPEYVI